MMSLRTVGYLVAISALSLLPGVLRAEPFRVSVFGEAANISTTSIDLQSSTTDPVNVTVYPVDLSHSAVATSTPAGFVATRAILSSPLSGEISALANANWESTFTVVAAGEYSLNFNVQPITLAILSNSSASFRLEIAIGIDNAPGLQTLYLQSYSLDDNGLRPLETPVSGGTAEPNFVWDALTGAYLASGYSGTINLGAFNLGQTINVQYVLISSVDGTSIAPAISSFGGPVFAGGATISQVGDPFDLNGPTTPQVSVTLNGPNDVNVPEPSSWLLFVCGGVALVAARRFTGLRSV